MQEEGWVGECRVSGVTLFMSFTPIGLSFLFVSASVHNVMGTGRFPQPRDAIGWAAVKESCGGWWVIISSIQIRGIMADLFLFFFFFYQWEERRGLFLILSQGQQRTQFREYNVTGDIKTPNPSTCLCDLSYSNHMGTVVRVYIRKAAGTWVVSHAADFSKDRHCRGVTEHCTILLPNLDVLFCVTAWPPAVCQEGVTKAQKLSGIVTDTKYDQCTCVFINKHILSCRGRLSSKLSSLCNRAD